MTHVLGFSSNKFTELIDENGNRRPSSQVVLRTTAIGANNAAYPVTLIITPSVVNFVRQQFNCSTVAGAQLEDGGGTGTSGSHWEKRLFKPDYMTGVLETTGTVISPLTLAFLSDTGWYTVDYSNAQQMTYGYGRGCAFLSDSCACAANQPTCSWPADTYACFAPNKPVRNCFVRSTSEADDGFRFE
jgi:hypothetical protein